MGSQSKIIELLDSGTASYDAIFAEIGGCEDALHRLLLNMTRNAVIILIEGEYRLPPSKREIMPLLAKDKKLNERVGHPNCYNREPFAETTMVQDGWSNEALDGKHVRIAVMKEVPNSMSKDCKQWDDFGEAKRMGWNCDGCIWKKIT